jgi:hypothetical protein
VSLFEQERVRETAGVIGRYLSTRPQATESVEGVAKWWLIRQRYEDSLELVQLALDLLVEMGELERVPVAGGKFLYRKSLVNVTPPNGATGKN